MKTRKNIASGAEWEDFVGYSRAVRIGDIIEVSGSVALENGKLVGENDPYLQTKAALKVIAKALREAGAKMEDVIRTRIYVRDIRFWKEIGRAHGELFGKIKPATSMVEVSKLIGDEYLVEIEATAILK